MNRREFSERFGDPADFAFRGQCYHSSTLAKCALCGREKIRNVYTLLSQGRSLPSGECCISLFQKWNPEMHTRLLAAKYLLNAYQKDIELDVKHFNASADVTHRLRQWCKLKQEALQRIRSHKKTTGSDWLPRGLYELKIEATKPPGKTNRWFNSHIPVLKEMLAKSSLTVSI